MSDRRNELTSFLVTVLSKRLEGVDLGNHDADLFELGLDSIDAVEVTSDIETRFGLELDPELVFECRTVNALADSVMASLAPEPAAPLRSEA